MNSVTPLPPGDPIERVRMAYWQPVSAPLRRLWSVGFLATMLGAARVAREGTLTPRLLAVVMVVGSVSWLLGLRLRQRRQRGNAKRVLSQIVQVSDRELGQKALRALRLRDRARVDRTLGSAELANHYFAGVVSQISVERIQKAGYRRGAYYALLGWLLLSASGFMVFAWGHEILEGFNVGLARKARAPFYMAWLEIDAVSALAPPYLHQGEQSILFGSKASEPVGTVITVRGTPLRANVELYLTNGQAFERFESSSEGELVAHFTVNKTERLRVAARFGEVVVEQQDELIVEGEPDTVPRVVLENANRVIRLNDVPRVDLFYEAEDDHGLREIDLVMQSVEREERRPLMRLDGQMRAQQGSHSLDVSDPFLRNARLPVKVRIEARDDNNLVENHWGHSDWLTLEPEIPGEIEVARLKELDGLRSALIDWYAAEVEPKAPVSDDEHRSRAVLDKIRELEGRTSESRGLPQPVVLLLRAQREQLQSLPVHSSKAKPVLESSLLTVDAAVHALAERDAKAVAQVLAELADEVAHGAHQAINSEKKSESILRLDFSEAQLRRSGGQLQQLGNLGADLGEIVRAALVRIERSRKLDDFTHVELTARYLAERLRRPEASAAQSSGVEAGAGSEASPTHLSASDANVRLERLLMELQQIRDEHKSGLELLEREINGAEIGVEPEENHAGAKERAARLRHLAEGLPNRGAEPDTAQSSENVAREQALGMAEAIERLSPEDTATRGRAAHDAINEALVRGSKESDSGIDRKALEALRNEVDSQMQRASQLTERTRQKAARAASAHLSEHVGRERQLSERTQALANRKAGRDLSLPESMRSELKRASGFMRQASESLESKDGDRAYDQEKRAQAILDQFSSKPLDRSSASRDNDASSNANHQGKPSPARDKGTVKSTGDPQAAAAFRRRVQQGLSQETPGELGATIRRYAEGLLR